MAQQTKAVISIIVTLAIASVILAAFAVGYVWELVSALLISCALAAFLMRFVFLPTMQIIATNKQNERDHYVEMLKGGALPNNALYYLITPAVSENDPPVDTSGQTQTTVIAYQNEALALLQLSVNWQRETNQPLNKIAPYSAAKSINTFRGGQGFSNWQHACQFLLLAIGKPWLSEQKMTGKRKDGTFVKAGTVAEALEALKRTTPPPTALSSGR